MNLTKRIIKACNSTEEKKLNIILLHSNERYESTLAQTGHNFFCPMFKDDVRWEDNIAKRPDNIFLLGEQALNYQYLSAFSPDLIIAQNRNKHWAVAKNICDLIHIPSVLIERYPPPQSREYNEQVEAIKKISADVNIFDNVHCQKLWNLLNSATIEDPIDTNIFKTDPEAERTQDLLTVIHNHDADPRVNAIWDFMHKEFPSIKCVGNYKNISTACASVEDLVKEYNQSKIYINMNMSSSSALKEAMLCGCVPVTMSDDLNNTVEDGVNGYVCMDLLEMKQKVEILLSNPEMANDMSQKAKESLSERCSVNNFVDAWSQIFNTIQKGIKQ